MPVARGLGLGFDHPLVTRVAARRPRPSSSSSPAWSSRHRLRLATKASAACTSQEPVLITADGPEVLSSESVPQRKRAGARHDRRRGPDSRGRSSCTRRIRPPRSPRITLEPARPAQQPDDRMRLRYADLLHQANIDDDVKVLVIRGVGDDFGTGADLAEFMEAGAPARRSAEEFGLEGRRRHLSAGAATYRPAPRCTQWFADPAVGLPQPPGVQEDQHRRGQGLLLRLALLPSRRCRPRHLVRRRAVRPPRLPLRRLTRRACGSGRMTMGMRKFQEMVFTGRPVHRRGDGRVQLRQQRRAPRPARGRGRRSTRRPAPDTRPTDVIFMQKTFFEIMKQFQGEYMGSLLSAWLESMGPQLRLRRGRLADPAEQARRWTRV